MENDGRFRKVDATKESYENDGLNSLQYTIVNHIEGLLYTLIQVKLWSRENNDESTIILAISHSYMRTSIESNINYYYEASMVVKLTYG